MNVTVIRNAGVDAALARFGAWWRALSRREQILVGALGTLLAGVILVYGVVKPLQAARADALADIRTYETLNARLRAAGPNLKAAVPVPAGPPEAAVTASATALGLAPRVSVLPAGGVLAEADGVAYPAALQWIADVSRTTPLRPASVGIVRQTTGRVAVRVEFR